MRYAWVVGTLTLFFIGQIISNTLEKQYAGTSIIDTFFVLMRPGFVEGGSIPIIGFFIVVWEWMKAFWGVLWWNYSFFTGYWEIFRYLGWTLSIGIIVSIVLAIRGVPST